MPLTDVFCPICYKTEFVKVTRKSLESFDHRSLHENLNNESDDEQYRHHHHHHHGRTLSLHHSHGSKRPHHSIRRLSMYEKELSRRDARIKNWLQQSHEHDFARIKVLSSLDMKPRKKIIMKKQPARILKKNSLILEEDENESDENAGDDDKYVNNLPYAAPYAASTPQSIIDLIKDDLYLPPLKADLTNKIAKGTPNPSVISPINLDKTEKIDFPVQELENETKKSANSKKSEKIQLSRSPTFESVEPVKREESPFRITINHAKPEEKQTPPEKLFGLMEREKSLQAKPQQHPPQVKKIKLKRGNMLTKKPGSPIPAEIQVKPRNQNRRKARTPSPQEHSPVKIKNPVRKSQSFRARTPSNSDHSDGEILPKLVKLKKPPKLTEENNKREENLPNIAEKEKKPKEESRHRSKPKYTEDEHDDPPARKERRREKKREYEDELENVHERRESNHRSKEKYKYEEEPERKEYRREKSKHQEDEQEERRARRERRRERRREKDVEPEESEVKHRSRDKYKEEEPEIKETEMPQENQKSHQDDDTRHDEKYTSKEKKSRRNRNKNTKIITNTGTSPIMFNDDKPESPELAKNDDRGTSPINLEKVNKSTEYVMIEPTEVVKKDDRETSPIIMDKLNKSTNYSIQPTPIAKTRQRGTSPIISKKLHKSTSYSVQTTPVSKNNHMATSPVFFNTLDKSTDYSIGTPPKATNKNRGTSPIVQNKLHKSTSYTAETKPTVKNNHRGTSPIVHNTFDKSTDYSFGTPPVENNNEKGTSPIIFDTLNKSTDYSMGTPTVEKNNNKGTSPIVFDTLNKSTDYSMGTPTVENHNNKGTSPIIHDKLNKSITDSIKVSPKIVKIFYQNVATSPMDDRSLLPSQSPKMNDASTSPPMNSLLELSMNNEDELNENKESTLRNTPATPTPTPPVAPTVPQPQQNIIKQIHHYHYYQNVSPTEPKQEPAPKPLVFDVASSPLPIKKEEIVISVKRDGSTQIIDVKSKSSDVKSSKKTPEPVLRNDQQFVLPLQSAAFIYDDDARSDTSGSSRPVTSHSAKRPQVVINNPNILEQPKDSSDSGIVIYKFGETPSDQSYLEEKRYVNESKKIHDMLNEKIDPDSMSELQKRPLSTIEEDETDDNGDKINQKTNKSLMSKLKLNKSRDQEQQLSEDEDVESTLTLASSRTIRNVKFDNEVNENGKQRRKILLPSEREISSREKALLFVVDNFSNQYKSDSRNKKDDEMTTTTRSGDEPTIRVTSGRSIATKSDNFSVKSEPAIRANRNKNISNQPIVLTHPSRKLEDHELEEIKDHLRLVESYRKEQGLHPKEQKTFHVQPSSAPTPRIPPQPLYQQNQYPVNQLVYPDDPSMYYYNNQMLPPMSYYDHSQYLPTLYNQHSQPYYYPELQQPQLMYPQQQMIYPQQHQLVYTEQVPQQIIYKEQQPNTAPNTLPVKVKKPTIKKSAGPSLIISNNTDNTVVINKKKEKKPSQSNKGILTLDTEETFTLD